MSVPVLCDVQDLIDIWRAPLNDDENNKLLRLIEKATALLLAKAPWVPARIAAGTLEPLIVSEVIAQVVKRFVQNPSGVTSESVGPWSVNYVDRYEGVDGSAAIKGGLSITKSDLDALKPYRSRASRMGNARIRAGLAPVHIGGYTLEPHEADLADPDGFPYGTGVDGAEVLGFRTGLNDNS